MSSAKEDRVKEKREKALQIQRGAVGEPIVSKDSYKVDIAKALSYYMSYSYKEKRAWLSKYLLGIGDKEGEKLFHQAEDFHIGQIGSFARLLSRGQYISEEHVKMFEQKKVEVTQYLLEKKKKKEEAPAVVRIDRSAAIISDALTEIDKAVDEFIVNKQSDFNPKVFVSTKSGLNSSITKQIQTVYQRMLDELESDDEQVQEGYSYFSKVEFRRFKQFISDIVNALGTSRVTVRKPRAKKVKPPEVLVAKLKYKKDPIQIGVEEISSIQPKTIIGSKELWVYNTKTRQVTVYKSDGGLQVHGSKIMNFDVAKSKSKRLRKPELFLGGNLAKKSINDMFDKVKATEYQPNGRINEEMILLKVF
jgi:hypothetical protein